MGVEDFNLASSLSLIIAQRLARRLCSHCKQPHLLDDLTCERLKLPLNTSVFQANKEGCDDCNKGYVGRVGIYEVMQFSREIAEALMQNATSLQLEDIAASQGMQRLRESGVDKLVDGITSLVELQRVLQL